ncbi:hypothetical protein [Nannocystis pusilla]|uniref:hypothetical protein n=1 Tax=Nannocystis pusilla TaxID=889268 RepID=UPI003B8269A1
MRLDVDDLGADGSKPPSRNSRGGRIFVGSPSGYSSGSAVWSPSTQSKMLLSVVIVEPGP